jgi:hypothetical protein
MVGLSLIKRKKEAVWNFYNGLLGTAGQRDLTLDLEVFHRPNGDLADLEQFFWRTKFGIPSKLVVRQGSRAGWLYGSILQGGLASDQAWQTDAR